MIPIRKRFFMAVEGESERSFFKWLYLLSKERKLHIHLEVHVLGGGGYQSMLAEAARALKKGLARGHYQERFLIVDSDRAGTVDWTLEKLRMEAAKHKIIACPQRPNHEGLLWRMTSGRENSFCDAAEAERLLQSVWSGYRKAPDARLLASHFSHDDLLRAARFDEDLRVLLQTIGLA